MHRVLLFSQYTAMLRRISERLGTAKPPYFTITGETKVSDRLELVNSFNSGDTPIFWISLKAGGTGLNLTGADVVIHYDPWWNSSAQNQASDRAHRIGQAKTVHIITRCMAVYHKTAIKNRHPVGFCEEADRVSVLSAVQPSRHVKVGCDYCDSFRHKVLRLIPSRFAATDWLEFSC